MSSGVNASDPVPATPLTATSNTTHGSFNVSMSAADLKLPVRFAPPGSDEFAEKTNEEWSSVLQVASRGMSGSRTLDAVQQMAQHLSATNFIKRKEVRDWVLTLVKSYETKVEALEDELLYRCLGAYQRASLLREKDSRVNLNRAQDSTIKGLQQRIHYLEASNMSSGDSRIVSGTEIKAQARLKEEIVEVRKQKDRLHEERDLLNEQITTLKSEKQHALTDASHQRDVTRCLREENQSLQESCQHLQESLEDMQQSFVEAKVTWEGQFEAQKGKEKESVLRVAALTTKLQHSEQTRQRENSSLQAEIDSLTAEIAAREREDTDERHRLERQREMDKQHELFQEELAKQEEKHRDQSERTEEKIARFVEHGCKEMDDLQLDGVEPSLSPRMSTIDPEPHDLPPAHTRMIEHMQGFFAKVQDVVAAVKGERVGMSDQLGDLRRLLSDFSSGGGFDMQNSAMGMSFAPELMTTPADEKHATLPVVEEKKNPPLEATLRKRIKRANFMPGQTQAIVKMVTRMEEQQIVKKQRWETKKMRILEESRKKVTYAQVGSEETSAEDKAVSGAVSSILGRLGKKKKKLAEAEALEAAAHASQAPESSADAASPQNNSLLPSLSDPGASRLSQSLRRLSRRDQEKQEANAGELTRSDTRAQLHVAVREMRDNMTEPGGLAPSSDRFLDAVLEAFSSHVGSENTVDVVAKWLSNANKNSATVQSAHQAQTLRRDSKTKQLDVLRKITMGASAGGQPRDVMTADSKLFKGVAGNFMSKFGKRKMQLPM